MAPSGLLQGTRQHRDGSGDDAEPDPDPPGHPAPAGREPVPLRVLLVEDDAQDARLLEALLSEEGLEDRIELVWVRSLSAAQSELADEDFDAALLDLGLPDASGLEAFRSLAAWTPDLPIVVLSGQADRSMAITAVREGAQDYLVKGRITGDAVERVLRYAVERSRLLTNERAQVRRQKLLLDVGELALDSRRPGPVLEAAVEVALEGLVVDRVHVLERCGDGLRLRAAVGSDERVAADTVVGLGPASWAGHAVSQCETVVVEDVAEERGFALGPLLEQRPPGAGLVVPIGTGAETWGALGAFAERPRRFTDGEHAFLRQLADLIAAAVRRMEIEGDRAERVRS